MADKMPPVPEARVVRTRAALAEAVARWPGAAPDTTWALVAVQAIPSAPELAALKHAAKTCDRVAAFVAPVTPQAPFKVLPNFTQTLRAAGCDVVWLPTPDKPLVRLEAADGADLRLFLQAVLAVLPSHVVAARAEPAHARVWKLLAAEFGDVLDVVMVA